MNDTSRQTETDENHEADENNGHLPLSHLHGEFSSLLRCKRVCVAVGQTRLMNRENKAQAHNNDNIIACGRDNSSLARIELLQMEEF